VPYASAKLLAAAAHDLAGSHALTIVTVPALLREIQIGNTKPVTVDGRVVELVPNFGGAEQRWGSEPFRMRETRSPLLAVWNDPPTFVRDTYVTSTLQRQRTSDRFGVRLFINPSNGKRSLGTTLSPDAAAVLREFDIKPVSRMSLAAWLGREKDFASLAAMREWFTDQTLVDRWGLGDFYSLNAPAYFDGNEDQWGLSDVPATNEEILAEIGNVQEPATRGVSSSTPPAQLVQHGSSTDDRSHGDVTDEDDLEEFDYRWTENVCSIPLRDIDIDRLTAAVLEELSDQHIHLPDADRLIRRCVVALLVGHLVLQGPPGTGKTTLARALAAAFNVALLESTATSEWSPYQVVGGLRPGNDAGLEPSYGKVTDAALQCAIQVRDERDGVADEGAYQASWLLIDEFNRADIDKAIGSLYTMLSSVSPRNLLGSPLDLWFERPGREQLWVPTRFRIIAAMNDLDTSFVNPLSQGLTRRFQFITVGTPQQADQSAEIEGALASAHEWLTDAYGGELSIPALSDVKTTLAPQLAALATVITGLRHPAVGTGWPMGSAQLVDLLKVVALEAATGADGATALDWAVADRLVPQMALLDGTQLRTAMSVFDDASLSNARAAIEHLIDPLTQV